MGRIVVSGTTCGTNRFRWNRLFGFGVGVFDFSRLFRIGRVFQVIRWICLFTHGGTCPELRPPTGSPNAPELNILEIENVKNACYRLSGPNVANVARWIDTGSEIGKHHGKTTHFPCMQFMNANRRFSDFIGVKDVRICIKCQPFGVCFAKIQFVQYKRIPEVWLLQEISCQDSVFCNQRFGWPSSSR